ncbi:MAG TPA: hypothetical protein VFT22_37040 [Kofleriaceae bacterium]|nr:hypothetical protein [Kofleriaceae bacterium]
MIQIDCSTAGVIAYIRFDHRAFCRTFDRAICVTPRALDRTRAAALTGSEGAG